MLLATPSNTSFTSIFLKERSDYFFRRLIQSIFAGVVLALILYCHPVDADELIRPDTVPEWYPLETCMEMMNVLIDEYSLTTEGAASIIGNICQESKFDPYANSGYYIGICQWDPYDRWPLISGWIRDHGMSTDSAVAQLRAIYGDENGHAEGDRYAETLEYMKNVTSVEDGVHRWLVYYEGAEGQQEAERISYAYDALEVYNAN